MANNYIYIVGPNPYDLQNPDNTRQNGEWRATAPRMEEALRQIFHSTAYPGETTGRRAFVAGISLAGRPGEEIIQVWSNQPKALEQTPEEIQTHDGRNHHLGLLVEIEVTEIQAWSSPVQGLLTNGSQASQNQHISPLGANIQQFRMRRHELDRQMLRENLELEQKRWDLEKMQDKATKRLREMQAQINLTNTYLHGTHCHTTICTGQKGQGPYHIFQNRQFLSEEVALLGNFQEFDFQQMEALEDWLVSSGQIWKLLPYERCILVTRIRSNNKDYGDPFVNLFKNQMNRQNIIWIRDGENVIHVDVETNFENAVFPDKTQFENTLNKVQDKVWQTHFACNKCADQYNTQPDWKPGTLKKTTRSRWMDEAEVYAEDHEAPYTLNPLDNTNFPTMEAWLNSEAYTPEIQANIAKKVQEYLEKKNREQMQFCLLLQGIVDHTQLLDIPPGTDLFNWESIQNYIVLVHDYRHALSDSTWRNKIASHIGTEQLRRGDWVIISKKHHPKYLLMKIADIQQGQAIVVYHPQKQRGRNWRAETNNILANRRKQGERRRLTSNSYENKGELTIEDCLRVPLSSDIAEKILDDREWKKQHKTLVPLLAQYAKNIQQQIKNPINMAPIELNEGGK